MSALWDFPEPTMRRFGRGCIAAGSWVGTCRSRSCDRWTPIFPIPLHAPRLGGHRGSGSSGCWVYGRDRNSLHRPQAVADGLTGSGWSIEWCRAGARGGDVGVANGHRKGSPFSIRCSTVAQKAKAISRDSATPSGVTRSARIGHTTQDIKRCGPAAWRPHEKTTARAVSISRCETPNELCSSAIGGG